ncbi:MAG: hypothetical protein DSY89_09530 [Deltaproteobacteria bacterium]|nr:MAG: hypothetical protein DSY89_09530 [Deltaproteobacteria bacterium]
MRKIWRILKWWAVVVAFVVAGTAFIHGREGTTSGRAQDPSSGGVHVRWVYDGDTIMLADGRRLRYLGVNTPEIDSKYHRGQPYAFVAKRFNRKLVGKQDIRIELDGRKKDRYGRLLAYVFLPDGTLVSQQLILKGYGYFYPVARPGKYDKRLLKAQRQAMSAKTGIWRKWREPGNGRGYIGNRRSRRFHRVDCRDGKKISRKNRCHFDTMWDAFQAGYAPAKGCINGQLGWHTP